ncbi:MAG TPA: Tex-like N-terminal domain-containing protein, partial [Spirochaetales bacterium]|nr:Tex-like N-terminal domain-containing protein [Spirochaetales bacterium]
MIDQSTIDGLTVDTFALQAKIAQDLQVRISQVSSVFQLADEGCTIPFISRYRKEKTGNLDEVQVREIFSKRASYTNLEERRIEIIKSIFNQGKLSDDLFENINKCTTLVELEEIYAPYKKKKKTRGMLAIEKGLEPLAEIIQTKDKQAVDEVAPQFICTNEEKPELSVTSAEEAIYGAMDIIAEKISQNPEYRAFIKQHFYNNCKLYSKGIDDAKKDTSVYQMYWDFSSPLKDVKPHHVLALNRAEREGEISVNLEPDYETTLTMFYDQFNLVNSYYKEAIQDSFERLIAPSVLRELRSDATEHAELHSITVFSTNLKHLLLTPPIKGNRVLGIDPGIRTGTKCAALDETGKFLGYFIINQEHNFEAGKEAVAKAVKEYGIQVIAVGNGTGSSDVCRLVSEAIQEKQLNVQFTIVDEDGASVYSASEIAREEFPELD